VHHSSILYPTQEAKICSHFGLNWCAKQSDMNRLSEISKMRFEGQKGFMATAEIAMQGYKSLERLLSESLQIGG
jgi:hypothetical protein